jgi:hypothetical protein
MFKEMGEIFEIILNVYYSLQVQNPKFKPSIPKKQKLLLTEILISHNLDLLGICINSSQVLIELNRIELSASRKTRIIKQNKKQ